jgi:hypothetical protein
MLIDMLEHVGAIDHMDSARVEREYDAVVLQNLMYALLGIRTRGQVDGHHVIATLSQPSRLAPRPCSNIDDAATCPRRRETRHGDIQFDIANGVQVLGGH